MTVCMARVQGPALCCPEQADVWTEHHTACLSSPPPASSTLQLQGGVWLQTDRGDAGHARPRGPGGQHETGAYMLAHVRARMHVCVLAWTGRRDGAEIDAQTRAHQPPER